MNLLLTGSFKYTEEQLLVLKKLFSITFIDSEYDDVKNPAIYDAIICNSLFLYNDINKFLNLKFIQLTSAGYDRIDMGYCNSHNIKVMNAKGVYSVPMAEWVILKILEILKRSRHYYENQTIKKWEKRKDILELNGKVATIAGFGSVGQEVAKRLKVFNVRINAVDIAKIDSCYYDEFFMCGDIEFPLSISEIVIVALPLNANTKYLFTDKLFNIMKDDSIFINVSRGAIINEDIMIKYISKFRGVALDVFEEEPLDIDSPLWGIDNVIITPHISYISEQINERLFNLLIDNLKHEFNCLNL